jgi:hypothetical protein
LPDVRPSDVIAIACSDIHLSERAPTARNAEPDWFAAMERPLFEMMQVWAELERPPILIAGDIFHKPEPPPALISFALRMFPKPAQEMSTDGDYVIAIPGQHDLPFHSMKDIEKTAFHILEMTETIRRPDSYTYAYQPIGRKGPSVVVYGFPWGTAAEPLRRHDENEHKYIALVHAYCWREGHSHPGAREEDHVDSWRERLAGYDLAIFGDNHAGFLDSPSGKMPILNCGGFMRRRIDEINYQPRFWLIYSDFSIESYPLDCSADKFINPEKLAKTLCSEDLDLTEFARELARAADKKLDFVAALKRVMTDEKIDERVMKLILSTIAEKK